MDGTRNCRRLLSQLMKQDAKSISVFYRFSREGRMEKLISTEPGVTIKPALET